MQQTDVIIIGAGIAGVSLAAQLPTGVKAIVLDMEERPAYHTTGRSAAVYEPNYGPAPMLAFTRASQPFFLAPPQDFGSAPLFTPRSVLFIEAEGQAAHTEKLLALGEGLHELTFDQAKTLCPVLNADYVKRVFEDRGTGDLDVDLLHGGFLRQFKANGGIVVLNAEVQSATRRNGQWHVTTPQGEFSAPSVVNAAGAWGDVIAGRFGVKPLGLTPKRRSIGVVPAPDVPGFERFPMITDMGETWYAKPQSGKLIVSSADATPVDPHDAYADDMAIAEGIERLMHATSIEVSRLEHSWGGLRTFTPDGSPAIGFDKHVEGFFWLVGQGGYGIQSSPALGRTAAAMVTGNALPADVMAAGLDLATISPNRFSN